MKAVDKYEATPNELPDALDNSDGNKIKEISRKMGEGNAFIVQAGEAIEKITESW